MPSKFYNKFKSTPVKKLIEMKDTKLLTDKMNKVTIDEPKHDAVVINEVTKTPIKPLKYKL
jgi:hypothetical protein